MWYEIIPAVALVAVGLTVPPIAGYGLNYLFNNGKVILNSHILILIFFYEIVNYNINIFVYLYIIYIYLNNTHVCKYYQYIIDFAVKLQIIYISCLNLYSFIL